LKRAHCVRGKEGSGPKWLDTVPRPRMRGSLIMIKSFSWRRLFSETSKSPVSFSAQRASPMAAQGKALGNGINKET
jgi:hypothetical protein